MQPLKIDELNKLHDDAKSLDKETVAEMRSNILLISGEHYSKRLNELWQRNRVNGSTQDPYSLRITKNWLHRAHRIYVNSILSQSPGVTVVPRNSSELQDQKSAELNNAVWLYAKNKYKLKASIRNFASDFCGIGECAVKVFFDNTKGDLKGYEPQIDEATGQPVIDEMGNPIADESKPVFTGEFVFERVYGQNIFRDPSCMQMSDAKWVGIEKLESSKHLKERYKGDEEKLKYITASTEEFVVFDSMKNGYSREKDQTLLLEYYFKPCLEYPEGYFYITTKAGILEEGPLPAKRFPIAWKGFDEHPTKARASSIVKVARPWNAEINRASSQAALHSITIGEDKILYQSGTKVTQGSLLPGVRGITYQGMAPTILPGRTGEQFFEYIAIQEQEMNRALCIDLVNEEKTSNLDPMAMLFRSMSQSQKFSFYSDKFGEFLVDMVEIYLDLAKFYLNGDELIAAIGRSELINIDEFKSTVPLNHQIQVQEQEDTIESQLGKQLVLNQILQYVGTNLERDDIGKLINAMPFGNWQDAFGDFTINEKNIKNDFLAIERGEMPQISPSDDSVYALKQVAKRKKERDFSLLSPDIQDMYQQFEDYHTQKQADEAAALKAAQSEFIPTGGAMVACDMYVPNEDPAKTPKRVRIPYQALDWLVKHLETQGMSMQSMEQMNQAQMSEVAGLLLGQGAQQQGQTNPQGVM
jgi:hypothetical protein